MPEVQNKCLILVDGSSFLFRAYHAIDANLSSPEGLPTNAIFGVANMLKKLVAKHQTDYFTVVFDAPGKNFRHELYAQYKANRPPIADDLRIQIKPLHNLIKAMGLPLIVQAGVEADDVIATLARLAERQGFDVIIATSDKDMAQLVNEHITLENTMSNTRMDSIGVKEKFGVEPTQIIDYLALMGDATDNIAGVAGVGPKTAAKWLKQYKNIDQLMACAAEIKGKVGENLRSSIEQLSQSRILTTIKDELKLNYTLDDLKQQPINNEELLTQLAKLGFLRWLEQLQDQLASSSPKKDGAGIATNYVDVLSEQQLEHWIEKLQKAELFALNIVATNLDYPVAEIVGISFAVACGSAAYIPLGHDYLDAPEQLDRDLVLEKLRHLLESPSHFKVGQNIKYYSHVLSNYGIELQGVDHDTMLESYILNSVESRHNLDALALRYLDVKTHRYEDVVGNKATKKIGFNQVPLEQATLYAAEDVDIALRLHKTLWPQLQQHACLQKLYLSVEIPIIAVLKRMESNGVLLDCAMLAQQSLKLEAQIFSIERQIFNIVGQSFNLNSPKQIQAILYDQLKLPVLKKTPKGQPSTAESVLQELAADYPLPKLILEYRSMSKLKSTYTDKLPRQVNVKTGRVHTYYHQAVTATGRLSSSDPNLQNIPIRSEQGRKIRQAFVATSGYKLLAADYSQIELRIMAHLSNDQGLLVAFAAGLDIHRATAAEVFSVAPDQVTTDLRRSAKAINFGLIYGMSAFGLAQQLGLSRSQAQDYINLYFKRYSGVKNYMDSTCISAAEKGYVETLFGRRLYLPEIKSRNASRRKFAERTAINAPMQGTAADIIKKAMIAVDCWLQNEQVNARMIMQVHDELVFEVDENEATDYANKINALMIAAAELQVPLVVKVRIGDNWEQAH